MNFPQYFLMIIWMDKLLMHIGMMVQLGKKCVDSRYKGGSTGVGKIFND